MNFSTAVSLIRLPTTESLEPYRQIKQPTCGKSGAQNAKRNRPFVSRMMFRHVFDDIRRNQKSGPGRSPNQSGHQSAIFRLNRRRAADYGSAIKRRKNVCGGQKKNDRRKIQIWDQNQNQHVHNGNQHSNGMNEFHTELET